MKINKRIVTLLSLVLLLALAVGGTLAFIVAKSGDVNNTFEPGRVSCAIHENGTNGAANFDGVTKTNVAVKNTGNIKAYIRAAVVVNWQDSQGNIYPKAPVADEDYTISINEEMQQSNDQSNFTTGKWVKNGDYYYWNNPVLSVEENATKCFTGILIKSCKPVEGETPEGYHLVVEVLASAIQADGVNAQNEKAVEDAWGVDPAALGSGN